MSSLTDMSLDGAPQYFVVTWDAIFISDVLLIYGFAAKSLLVEQQDESLLPSAGSYVKVLSCLHLFLHLSETA